MSISTSTPPITTPLATNETAAMGSLNSTTLDATPTTESKRIAMLFQKALASNLV